MGIYRKFHGYYASYNSEITDVSMLTNLTTLSASYNSGITDVSMLTNLTTLYANRI